MANSYNSLSNSVVADSRIYRYNSFYSSFDAEALSPFQAIQTRSAFDLEFFEIGGEKYLAVANHYNEFNSYCTDSKIYKSRRAAGQAERSC